MEGHVADDGVSLGRELQWIWERGWAFCLAGIVGQIRCCLGVSTKIGHKESGTPMRGFLGNGLGSMMVRSKAASKERGTRL